MKKPFLQPLLVSNGLSQIITRLPNQGYLARAASGLIYLAIDDNYIHRVFPLLINYNLSKPAYFSGTDAIGAHISVIYNDEVADASAIKELGALYFFTIEGLFSTQILKKTYYALKVDAPKLLQLRKNYNLPEQLNFNGYEIGLHITVGFKN